MEYATGEIDLCCFGQSKRIGGVKAAGQTFDLCELLGISDQGSVVVDADDIDVLVKDAMCCEPAYDVADPAPDINDLYALIWAEQPNGSHKGEQYFGDPCAVAKLFPKALHLVVRGNKEMIDMVRIKVSIGISRNGVDDAEGTAVWGIG